MTEALPRSVDEMKDILDIEPVFFDTTAHWLRVGLAAFTTIAILILVYSLYRYFKKRRAARLIELSPYERAIKDLETLRKSRYYTEREWAPFYFLLTEAFKRFVTGHGGVDVLDRTIEEMFRMKSDFARLVDETGWERVKSFLLRGDQIKFAKVPATPTQAAEDFDFVEKFVRNAAPPAPSEK